jgi:SAM-dependent methyltransferase
VLRLDGDMYSSTADTSLFLEMATCPVCMSDGTPVYIQRDLLCSVNGEFGQRHCADCGLFFLSPRVPENNIGRYYPASYLPYRPTPTNGLIYKLAAALGLPYRRRRILERFARKGRILDVGCGNGSFLQTLEQERWERHAMDIAQHWQFNGNVRFYAGRFDHEKPPLRQLDVITLWHVFEHLYHPQQALHHAAELLTEGGYLLLAIPDPQCIERWVFGKAWIGWDPPRHLTTYSRKSLSILLDRAGLRLVSVVPDYCNGQQLALNIDMALRSAGVEQKLHESVLLQAALTPVAELLSRGSLAPAKVYVAQK